MVQTLGDRLRVDACVQFPQRGGESLEIVEVSGRCDVCIRRKSRKSLEACRNRSDEDVPYAPRRVGLPHDPTVQGIAAGRADHAIGVFLITS